MACVCENNNEKGISGVCCGYGNRSFTLTVDGDVALSGGAFGSFSAVKVEATTPSPVSAALVLFGSALACWFGLGRRAVST